MPTQFVTFLTCPGGVLPCHISLLLSSVVPEQRGLGSVGRGRGSPAEERRLVAVQVPDCLQHQPPPSHHGNTAAELSQGAVVPASLHHARQVSRNLPASFCWALWSVYVRTLTSDCSVIRTKKWGTPDWSDPVVSLCFSLFLHSLVFPFYFLLFVYSSFPSQSVSFPSPCVFFPGRWSHGRGPVMVIMRYENSSLVLKATQDVKMVLWIVIMLQFHSCRSVWSHLKHCIWV